MGYIEDMTRDILMEELTSEYVEKIAKALNRNKALTSTYALSVTVEDIQSVDRYPNPSKSGFYFILEGTRSGVSFFYNNNLEITRKPDSRKTTVVKRYNNIRGFEESFWCRWADKWLSSTNELIEKITKKSDGYYVTSEDGKKNLGGPYKKKEDAEKRLNQVEYFKNLKEGDKSMEINKIVKNALNKNNFKESMTNDDYEIDDFYVLDKLYKKVEAGLASPRVKEFLTKFDSLSQELGSDQAALEQMDISLYDLMDMLYLDESFDYDTLNEFHNLKRNYKNVSFATKELEKKGYSHNKANDLALKIFDVNENDTSHSLEWFIDKILPKDEYEREYGLKENINKKFEFTLYNTYSKNSFHKQVECSNREEAEQLANKELKKLQRNGYYKDFIVKDVKEIHESLIEGAYKEDTIKCKIVSRFINRIDVYDLGLPLIRERDGLVEVEFPDVVLEKTDIEKIQRNARNILNAKVKVENDGIDYTLYFDLPNNLDESLTEAVEIKPIELFRQAYKSGDYVDDDKLMNLYQQANEYYKKHPIDLHSVPNLVEVEVDEDRIDVDYDSPKDLTPSDIEPAWGVVEDFGSILTVYPTNKTKIIYVMSDLLGDVFTTMKFLKNYFRDENVFGYEIQEQAAEFERDGLFTESLTEDFEEEFTYYFDIDTTCYVYADEDVKDDVNKNEFELEFAESVENYLYKNLSFDLYAECDINNITIVTDFLLEDSQINSIKKILLDFEETFEGRNHFIDRKLGTDFSYPYEISMQIDSVKLVER